MASSNSRVLSESTPKMMEEAAMERQSRVERMCELGLRVVALSLTLAAALMVGVDKETKIVSVTIAPSLPALHVPVTAKWSYMSAFVYVFLRLFKPCLDHP